MVEIGPDAQAAQLAALLDRVQAAFEQSRHLAVISRKARLGAEARCKQLARDGGATTAS